MDIPSSRPGQLADLVVEPVRRDEVSLNALATLRMTVFRTWPYLYDGSDDYEASYLSEFLRDDAAVIIVARIGEIPVGMATASPMQTQAEEITRPFRDAGYDLSSLFYFGESVLLPQFRGMGIGHRFFDEREAVARKSGAMSATFCAVTRPLDHPMRPAEPRKLDPFWEKRGYRPVPSLHTSMTWKDIGEKGETAHVMQFWTKTL